MTTECKRLALAFKCFAPQAGQNQDRDGEDDPIKCKVTIRARRIDRSDSPVGGGAVRIGMHAYILTTQSNQNFSTVYHATPINNTLTAEGARYGPQLGYDYERSNPVNVSQSFDGSCDNFNASFQGTVDLVNSSNVAYGRFSTNSNAFVSTALGRAGLNANVAYNALYSRTPTGSWLAGWGTTLPLR